VRVMFRSLRHFIVILLAMAISEGYSCAKRSSGSLNERPSTSSQPKLLTKREPTTIHDSVTEKSKARESASSLLKTDSDVKTPSWNKQRGPLPPLNARIRTIYPNRFLPRPDHCEEMYTACRNQTNGNLCNSAIFFLECGERSRHPETGEWVACECSKK
jgi:hypothetical protein